MMSKGEMDFTKETEQIQTGCLHIYKGVTSDICHTLNYDENSDINTTYLHKAPRQRSDKCKAKEFFKLNDQSRTVTNLLDGT